MQRLRLALGYMLICRSLLEGVDVEDGMGRISNLHTGIHKHSNYTLHGLLLLLPLPFPFRVPTTPSFPLHFRSFPASTHQPVESYTLQIAIAKEKIEQRDKENNAMQCSSAAAQWYQEWKTQTHEETPNPI
jgi:hypothetical protein